MSVILTLKLFFFHIIILHWWTRFSSHSLHSLTFHAICSVVSRAISTFQACMHADLPNNWANLTSVQSGNIIFTTKLTHRLIFARVCIIIKFLAFLTLLFRLNFFKSCCSERNISNKKFLFHASISYFFIIK